ncbi:MAG: DUF4340 domain-containing protein [Planctomycetota bacterium]|jgi:hypothetical protein
MSDKKLTILGIIAVAMAGLAILQSRISQQSGQADFGSSPLVAGLNIEAVASIEVTSQGGSQKTTLKQQNGKFVVADNDNYPADVSKINALINDCLDIRVTDKVTSNAANHADLKVTEEAAEYVIAFNDTEGKPIVSAILSPVDLESNVAHGRLASSHDVYAVQAPPQFSTGSIDFVNCQLVSISQPDINSVAVKTPAGSYVLKSAADNSDVRLENMPEGKQFKGTDYTSVFGALSSVMFEDVQGTASASDLTFDYSYTCKLKDLKVYKLKLAKKDDAVYAKVSATYLDATPVEKTVGQVESDEELKKKEAKLLAIDEVKNFTAKHKGWIYKIPSYKADNLTKTLADLIEDIPQPEELPLEKTEAVEQVAK